MTEEMVKSIVVGVVIVVFILASFTTLFDRKG
jgi:hypothetical protein